MAPPQPCVQGKYRCGRNRPQSFAVARPTGRKAHHECDLFLRACLAACFALGQTAVSLAQAPSISYTTPHAVAPGQATDIVLFGGGLAGPTGAWWSLPVEAIADAGPR